MKKQQQGVTIFLFLIGLSLIFLTYFYYPQMNKVKIIEEKNLKSEEEESISLNASDSNFENVEYAGIYNVNNKFTVKSEKAYITNDNPDVVHMKKMNVVINLADGRVVEIFSDEGRYNKLTYDCFFEKNVEASDGQTKITSANLDLLSTESVVEIYNNVYLNNPTGSLIADKINYDFIKKYFSVLMFDENDTINMKVIE
jgi:hypothetical protein